MHHIPDQNEHWLDDVVEQSSEHWLQHRVSENSDNPTDEFPAELAKQETKKFDDEYDDKINQNLKCPEEFLHASLGVCLNPGKRMISMLSIGLIRPRFQRIGTLWISSGLKLVNFRTRTKLLLLAGSESYRIYITSVNGVLFSSMRA